MKRELSLLIVVCLILSLTGCGKKTDKKEESTTATSASTTVTASTTQETTEEPTTLPPLPPASDDEIVRVKDYIPTIRVELAYATENNFTKKVIYDFEDAYLRYGTIKKLKVAQEEFLGMGYSILVWDGFRPVSAQEKLWEAYPDPTFVANPKTGYSSHSRGNTVDITLVDLKTGELLEMPTDFDAFGAKADRDYSDCTEKAAKNARMFEDVMIKHGFTPYSAEWWHYSDTESYEVSKDFQPPKKVSETETAKATVVETEIVTVILADGVIELTTKSN